MITLPDRALNIITRLKDAGFEAYAVGGSVRDSLMNRPTKGWDFTTNAKPEEILALFPDSFYDNRFGTVGIKIYKSANGKSANQSTHVKNEENEKQITDIYEITTYRSEKEYTDFRHPDHIEWGKTLEEDLSRRDFTMNAIASDGKRIVDPYGGREDISQKVIRTVGTPSDRFREDALRMMRAVRFAAELGFVIETQTGEAIRNQSQLLTKISAERIRDEFLKILSAPFGSDAILVLKNTGLLHFILPELEAAFRVPQKSPKRHHIYDVGTHSVMAMKHCPSPDPVIRLAALIHDLGKVTTMRTMPDGVITFYNHEVVGYIMAKDLTRRLRLSKKQTDLVLTLVRWHQFSVDERQTDAALRRFIRRVGKENLEAMLAVRIGDRLGGGAQETSWRLELYKKRLEEVQQQPFTVADLQVDGHDVMKEFSIKPGPVIGQVLDTLFSEVEAGTLPNEREVLLTRLRELKAGYPDLANVSD